LSSSAYTVYYKAQAGRTDYVPWKPDSME